MTGFQQLTPELLESFLPNTQIEGTHPLVKVTDPNNGEVICNVWVYDRGTYGDEQHVLLTDITSRSAEYMQLINSGRSPEPRYGDYIRHLRDGRAPGEGNAILPRSRMIELLKSKQYTIS